MPCAYGKCGVHLTVIACASERDGGRAEFAGGKGVESTETAAKLEGGQALFAVQRTEKVGCGAATLEGVTFDAAGDEVAVGIILKFDAGDDVVEAAHGGGEAATAIKTEAAFTVVDRIAQGATLQEVLLLGEAVTSSG